MQNLTDLSATWTVLILHRVQCKIKMKGPLFKSYEEFQDGKRKILNQEQGPSACEGPV